MRIFATLLVALGASHGAAFFTSVHARSSDSLACADSRVAGTAFCDASAGPLIAQASASAGGSSVFTSPLAVGVDGTAYGRTATAFGEARVDDTVIVEGGSGSGILTVTYWADEINITPWCAGCTHAKYSVGVGSAFSSGDVPRGYFSISTPFVFGEPLAAFVDLSFYDSTVFAGEFERTIAELRYVGCTVQGFSGAYLESLQVPEPDTTLLFSFAGLGLILLRYRS